MCTQEAQTKRRGFLLISQVIPGSKREIEDRIIPRSADADDDAEIKSDDERSVAINLFCNYFVSQNLCWQF